MEYLVRDDPFVMNGITLSYIGDAVFELLARTHVLKSGSRQADKLHKRTIMLVNSLSQSKMADALLGSLQEKEKAIFKRGRNSSTINTARHHNIASYRKATGLEALFGYLFLSGNYERMEELFSRCLEIAGIHYNEEGPGMESL